MIVLFLYLIISMFLPKSVIGQQLNSSALISFTVVEKSSIGTVVGDVKKSITNFYTPEDLLQMQLSFRVANAFFSIDSNTGVIRVNSYIDRDVICAYQDTCKQNLEVQLKTASSFQIIKLTIDVTDINDHSPVFMPPFLVLNISEQAVPGTMFLLPSADDPDGGIDGIQSYSIVPLSAQFELVVNELADGSSDVRLRLKTYLVRMQAGVTYSLTVSAVDGGSLPRSGYLVINVTVTASTSINALTFNKSTYDVTVKENIAIGTVLLYVTTTEEDSKRQVLYNMDDYSQQQYGKILSLNNKTGALVIIGTLDYEQYRVCQLTIIAVNTDKPSSSQLPAYARVTITVQDVNDNTPRISVSTTSSGPPQVLVQSPLGTFVAYIALADDDSTSSITCVIDNPLFSLQPVYTDYNLLTAVVFSREYLGEYVVTILCQDNGIPSLSSSQVIKVLVQGSGPRFASNIIGIGCVEGNSVGARLYTLNATTSDVGKAAVLSYSISSLENGTASVWVNSGTGEVSAMTVFRYDVKQRYLYVATVTDNNEIPLSATVTLVLDITRAESKSNNSVPLIPSVAPNSAGGGGGGAESNSVVITAVVCATVIVAIIIIVIVVSVLCYRRRNGAADKRKNQTSVLAAIGGAALAPCQRQTSISTFNEDNKLNDVKEIRSDSSFDESFSGRNSFVWPDPILGLPPKYPQDLSPKRGVYSSDRLTWQQKRERLESRYTIKENGSEGSHITDPESDSGGSGSFADSGRGPSEESEIGSYAYHASGEITQKGSVSGLSRRPSRSRHKRSRSGFTPTRNEHRDATYSKDTVRGGSVKSKNQKIKTKARTMSPNSTVSVSMSPEGKQSPRSASTSPNSWMPNSSRRSSPSIISSPRDNIIPCRKSVTFSRENSPNYLPPIGENFQQNEYETTSCVDDNPVIQNHSVVQKQYIPSNVPPLLLRENSPNNQQQFSTRGNSPRIRQSISPKIVNSMYRQSVSSRENSPSYQEPISPIPNGSNYPLIIPRKYITPGYNEPISPTENSRLQLKENTIKYRHTMYPRKSNPHNHDSPDSVREHGPVSQQQVLGKQPSSDYQEQVSVEINDTDYPLPYTPEDNDMAECIRQHTLVRSKNSASYKSRQTGQFGKQTCVYDTKTAMVENNPTNHISYTDRMMRGDENLNDKGSTMSRTLNFDAINSIPMCDTFV